MPTEAQRTRFLRLVTPIALEAAAQPELRTALRRIRHGVLRLGFAQAVTWIASPDDPTLLEGTRDVADDSSDTGEDRFLARLDGSPIADEIHRGARVVLRRLASSPDRFLAPDRSLCVDGPPNCAWVPLRVDGELVGLLAASVAATAEPLNGDQLTALLLLGDQVAISVARLRAMAVLDATLTALPSARAALLQQAITLQALHDLDRFKADLITSVSHELRTPLAVIYGYAELLDARSEDILAENIRFMAGEILASSIALTHLIDDMLDFSRLQQGSTTVQVEAVDLARVLHDAADAFRRVPGGERLTLEISDTLPAWADPVRTRRIVDSLLINASRYARNDSITLRGIQQCNEVWIEVTGGWPSVWPEEHARVWRQFYQGPQPALPTDVHAMGLALTLVKALAEAQSGRVVFDGESIEGGVVRVILPAPEASVSTS